MIYVSKGHSEGRMRPGNPTETELHKQHRPMMKSISMVLLDRATYATSKLLKPIWKHAGFLCVEVVFNHDHVMPDGGLSHTYDLYFQWGRFGDLDVTNEYLNGVVWKIEQDLMATGEFDLRGRTHGKA
jgi:hypothetical protein